MSARQLLPQANQAANIDWHMHQTHLAFVAHAHDANGTPGKQGRNSGLVGLTLACNQGVGPIVLSGGRDLLRPLVHS